MKMLQSIPAMPVSDMNRGTAFYRDQVGFTLGYHDDGFAILRRDTVEIHLWGATDQSWRTRERTPEHTAESTSRSPVVSGAESFIAGTASCRIGMQGVDDLYEIVQPLGIVHPRGSLTDTEYGTREFGVLDPDCNLITFFERPLERKHSP